MSKSPSSQLPKPIVDAANAIANADGGPDVFLYNGEIQHRHFRKMARLCRDGGHRDTVMLILVTPGGDPNAAYRMARCLQSEYDRFQLFVSGYCKSAGTLVSVGAHELIFSDDGE